MRACLKRVAFFHDHRAFCQVQPKELLDHPEGFLAAHHCYLWVKLNDARNQGAVIRLHVLNDHVIQRTTLQRRMKVL